MEINSHRQRASLMPPMRGSPKLSEIPCHQLRPNPYQPRTTFNPDALEQLANSIRENGVLGPILVRPTFVEDHYEIIAGERRFRAAEMAGLDTVPVVIRSATDQEMALWALVENQSREDLNPIDTARAYQRLMHEFNLSQKAIAEAMGVHEKTVSHHIRLLKLDQSVIEKVQAGDIPFAHARLLVSLPVLQQRELADKIVSEQMTRRQLERRVKVLSPQANPLPPASVNVDRIQGTEKKDKRDSNIVELENRLSETVGLQTTVEYQPDGSGKVSFVFHSLDELDGLLAKLNVYETGDSDLDSDF